MSFTVTVHNISCIHSDDGAFHIVATGGTAPIQYSLFNVCTSVLSLLKCTSIQTVHFQFVPRLRMAPLRIWRQVCTWPKLVIVLGVQLLPKYILLPDQLQLCG